MRVVTGDLAGNTDRIKAMLENCRDADIVVFPETSISGYCCGARFDQEHFVRYNMQFLEEILKTAPREQVIVIGYVHHEGSRPDGFPRIFNSAAVIQNGEVVGVHHKYHLARAHHHEDEKYFLPGPLPQLIHVKVRGRSVALGVPICEDIWVEDHELDVVGELVAAGADLILVPNFSYFYGEKMQIRHELCARQAARWGIPIVYVNAVGIGDIVKNIMIFDGGSFVVNKRGDLLAQAHRFSQQAMIVDLEGPPIEIDYDDALEEIYQALIFEQRELFDVLGLERAQIHVSGGIDSAVVACLVHEAMGSDRTVLISNPTDDNTETTRALAQDLADNLGLTLHWNPTQGPYEAVLKAHEAAFGTMPTLAARASAQAVLRTVQGLVASHHWSSGIVATGNQTEIVFNWSSFHDIGSIGVHAIIGDLTKLELYDLARHINRRSGRELIPPSLYDGTVAPAAELADFAEDPIDYWVVSGICAEMIRSRKGPLQIISEFDQRNLPPGSFPKDEAGREIYDRIGAAEFASTVWEAFRNSQISVFKAAQAAPIVTCSPRSRGFSNRETIIDGYEGHYEIGNA